MINVIASCCNCYCPTDKNKKYQCCRRMKKETDNDAITSQLSTINAVARLRNESKEARPSLLDLDASQLFRDTSDLNLKNDELEKTTRYRIYPDSAFKKTWDALIYILVMYNAISVPFEAAFAPEATLLYRVIDIFADITFVVDLCFSFFTAYETKTHM